MLTLRRLLPRLAALALLSFGAAPFPSGIGPAIAQAPPAVPALPDAERRTSYSVSATICGCSVGFQLYGSGTDVDQWIEVWIGATRYLSTDPSFGWKLTSATGSLATIPRPITDAVLTFNAVQTGTVQIVGAERPRRTAQFAENRGVAARDLNQAISDLVAVERELWDKTNDVTGRALLGLPGEALAQLPPAATRAGKYLGFDGTGLVPVASPSVPGTGVGGPPTSVVGHIAIWNNTTGTLLADGGTSVPFIQTGTGAIARTIDAKLKEGALSVKDFGALCDGATDDSTAINLADAAAAAAGKALYFPAGTCMAQNLNPRRANLEWFGDGPFLSTIKMVGGSVFDTVVWFGERTATTQYSQIYVHDLGFNGNGLGSNAVLEIRNISQSNFENLFITNGSATGLRAETSTASINTQLLRNRYVLIESSVNVGRGMYFIGDKDSEYESLFSHNNTGEGIYFGPANLNASALCETTQAYGGHILARDNGNDGIVFDEAEKYAFSSIQTSINAGYGIRFKSTYTGCTSTGSNSVSIAALVARNDALGAFRVADGGYMYGAKFGTIWIRGDNSTVGTTAMQLDGVQSTQFGSVEIEGWPGIALLIESGTPLGVAHDSDHLGFGSVLLRSNGNAGAGTNHGLSALNATGKVNIGSLISENTQTAGGNFELNVASTVVQFYINNAILNANAAGTNEISAGTADLHMAVRRIGTKTLLGGPTTGSNEITAAGGAAPAPSACGTSPSVSGSNTAGLITTGTATPVSCTITFAAPGYTSTPYCVVTAQTSAQMTAYALTNTTITLTTTATNNVKVNYRCDGQIGG